MEAARENRWAFAISLINNWWALLTQDDGVMSEDLVKAEQRLSIQLPDALREWYEMAGKREDFVGNQDYLIPVEELKITDNTLVFCVENQAVVEWGIRLRNIALPDPPVYVDLNDYPEDWKTEAIIAAIEADKAEETQYTGKTTSTINPDDVHTCIKESDGDSFSEFMTWKVAQATLLTASYTGTGPTSQTILSSIEQNYERFQLPNLVGDEETLISMASSEQIWLAARNKSAVERFLSLVGRDWGEINHTGPT